MLFSPFIFVPCIASDIFKYCDPFSSFSDDHSFHVFFLISKVVTIHVILGNLSLPTGPLECLSDFCYHSIPFLWKPHLNFFNFMNLLNTCNLNGINFSSKFVFNQVAICMKGIFFASFGVSYGIGFNVGLDEC